MQASELHDRVEAAFNAGDVDALVALYEDDACMVGENGEVARGLDAIRDVWKGFTAFGGRIRMTTTYAVETGDTALLSNVWSMEIDGAVVASAQTAEVARRSPDGSWRYVIDNPTAAPAPAGDTPPTRE